jgi:hypothetical protein
MHAGRWNDACLACMKKRLASRFFFRLKRLYLPLEPVLLPELELVSLGVLVLLDPLVPLDAPVLPGVLVLPPVPLVPGVLPLVPPLVPAALPEVPDEAEDFLAFLCFLAFFFFGVVAPALVSLWPEDVVADGVVLLLLGVAVLAPEPDAPLVSPEAPVELLPPVEEPLLMPLPLVPLLVPLAPLVPDAPLPEVPDAPEESVVPDAPLDDVPLVPEAPEEEAPGVAEEVPELPDMPASVPVPAPVAPVEPCEAGLEEVEDGLLVSVEELCANAIEDTDAIRTIDKDRSVVFNVMRNSFG